MFVCLRKCVVCALMFAANNKNKKKFHITRNGKPKGFPLCQFQTKYLCSSSLLLEQLVPEITILWCHTLIGIIWKQCKAKE